MGSGGRRWKDCERMVWKKVAGGGRRCEEVG